MEYFYFREMFNTTDRKQRVMSSQTNLALSELDLEKFEWDNEDEDEDGREDGKFHRLLEYHNEGDRIYNYLEASDNNAKVSQRLFICFSCILLKLLNNDV